MPRFLVPFALSLLAASASATVYDLSSNAALPRPAVAGDGAGYLAVWVEKPSGSDYPVVAGRFTRDAGPLDAGGIRLGAAPTFSSKVAVAYGGGVYLVLWDGDGGVTGAVVTPDGIVSRRFLIDAKGRAPALSWNGASFFAVWEGCCSDARGIRGAAISTSGIVGTVRPVSPQEPPLLYPRDPQIAWNGQQYILAWRVDREITACTALCVPTPTLGEEIIRLAADGTPVDSQATTLMAFKENVPVYGVRVAASSESALLTLDLGGRVDVVALRSDFTPLRRTFFQWYRFDFEELLTTQNSPDVTFDGTSFVIAVRLRDGAQGWLATARVPANGDDATFARQVVSVGDPEPSADPAPALAAGTAVVAKGSRVRAYFPDDLGGAPPEPPAPPHDVVAVPGYNSVQLTWSGGDGAAGFIIERAGYNGFHLRQVVHGGTTRTATVAASPSDDPGAFRVLAYNAGGISLPSAPVFADRPRRRTTGH